MKKLFKIIFSIFKICLIVAVFTVCTIVFSETIRLKLIGTGLVIANKTGYQIDLVEPVSHDIGNIEAKEISVAYQGNKLVYIKNLTLDWMPMRLLTRKRVRINNITASEITYYKPAFPAPEKPEVEEKPLKLLPVQIRNINIDSLKFIETAPEEITKLDLKITGYLTLIELTSEGIRANLAIYDNKNDRLILNVESSKNDSLHISFRDEKPLFLNEFLALENINKVNLETAIDFSNKEVFKINLSNAAIEGTINGKNYIIKTTANLSYNSKTSEIIIDNANVASNNNSGSIKGFRNKEGFSFESNFQKFPLDFINLFVDAKTIENRGIALDRTYITSDLKAEGSFAEKDTKLNLNGYLNVSTIINERAFELRANTATDKESISADIKLSSSKNTLTETKIVIGNSINGFAEKLPLQVNGNSNLKNLNQFFNADSGTNLVGEITYDVKFEDAKQLLGTGSFIVKNAGINDDSSAVELRNINLTAKLNENRSVDIDLSASDFKNGKLNLKGNLALNDTLELNKVDLNGTAKEFKPLNRQDLELQTSGTFSLKDQGSNFLAKTELDIEQFNIYPKKLNTYSVPEVKVKYKKDIEKEAKEAQTTQLIFGDRVLLDLDINANNQIRIIGNNINAELKGNITVDGSVNKPIVGGSLNVVRGRASILGKSFELSDESEVKFQENKAYIDFLATTKTKDKTVNVKIYGYNDELSFDFTSDPSAAKDEIIANLLFDKNSQNLNAFEAIKLGSALNSLNKDSSGTEIANPLSDIQDFLNKNNIMIGQDEETNNVNLGIGKYLTDKIYLEILADPGSKSGNPVKTKTEIELTPSISINSETGGSAGTGGAELQWKRDY